MADVTETVPATENVIFKVTRNEGEEDTWEVWLTPLSEALSRDILERICAVIQEALDE